MDSTMIIFFASILIVGAILFAIISLTSKGRRVLDVDKYRSDWLKIEHQLKPGDETSYQLCILNADKLLDRALKESGIRGETMGERMRAVSDIWKNRNDVWSAHKLRNQLVHETDVKISEKSCRYALRSFRQGLKDLGAI